MSNTKTYPRQGLSDPELHTDGCRTWRGRRTRCPICLDLKCSECSHGRGFTAKARPCCRQCMDSSLKKK